ncbi:MAG: hypothetical protein WEC00_10070, partial [Dongiaceae bacterium]
MQIMRPFYPIRWPVLWILLAMVLPALFAFGLLASEARAQTNETPPGDVFGTEAPGAPTSEDGWAAYDRGDYPAAREIFEGLAA